MLVMIDSIYLLSICVSSLTFVFLNKNFDKLLRPQSVDDNGYKLWKWKNILTSLFHSFVVGFGVLISIIFERWVVYDMLRGQSSFGNALICISTGYFVYDLILSVTNLQYPGRIEIIVHHMITLSCLMVSIWQKRFLAYCVVGLSVEISSFFIHIRELLSLSGVSKLSKVYAFNTYITIFTLIMFRFLPLTWITIGIYRDRQHIELALLLMAVIFLAIIYLVSSVLLYRVITTDYDFNISIDLMEWIETNTKLNCKCSSKLRKIL